MKKTLIALLLLASVFVVACQPTDNLDVDEKMDGMMEDTTEAIAPEQVEIAEGLDDLEDLDALANEDFNFDEVEQAIE